MKRKSIILIAAALLMGSSTILLSSCGKKSGKDAATDHPVVADADLDPIDYEHGANAITPDQLNEIIMMPDDLTPGQAAGALLMLSDRISGLGGTKRVENMRNFVDLYGIMIDIHGDNMRTALQRLKKNTGIDLETIYADYTSMLKVGDEAGASDPDEVQATISTVNDEIESEDGDQNASEANPEAAAATNQPQSVPAGE